MTRIYLTRSESELGFKKLGKYKFTNIETDWMDVFIKIEKNKMTVKLNEKPVCVALEESDDDYISKIHGTFMFGINGAKVEFADFRVSAFKPPVDQDPAGTGGQNSGSGSGPGSSASATGESGSSESSQSEQEIDEEIDEETVEAETEDARPSDSSNICKSKTTCGDRGTWCTEMYKDSLPADCVDRFEDYCCGELATQNIIECKQEVAQFLAPVDAEPLVTQSCFDQSAIDGAQMK